MNDGVVFAGGKQAEAVDGLTLDVKIVVTKKQIAYLLCTGFEGGIGYWCPRQEFRFKRPKKALIRYLDGDEKDGRFWDMYDLPLQVGGEVRFNGDDDAPKKNLVLNLKTIAAGLQVMAAECPRHFANFVNDNYDAVTGDVFIQCCVFGTVIYG